MQNDDRLVDSYKKALEFEKKEEVIGIQKEKILHKTLKYYLEENEAFHEVKLKKPNKGIIYADIYKKSVIYEIQTRGFDKLRSKLENMLESYKVVLVHAIAYEKYIYKIEDTGEVIGPVKSPKKGSIFDIFKELYKIKYLLKNENLSFKILLINMDEYRNVVPKKHYKSSGYIRERQIPKRIVKEYDINSTDDFKKVLLEYNLKENFTSKEFAKIVKTSLKNASVALNILDYLGIVTRVSKKGNSFIYEIKK